MYLETNLSATDIVSKIKALLDICHVDYENVGIYYEYKESKKRTINSLTITEKRTENVIKSGHALVEKEDSNENTFDKFFEGEKYKPLYIELKKKGINTLEKLKEINLWSFMNLHQLYSIQQRLTINTELTAKLRDAWVIKRCDAVLKKIPWKKR